MYNSFTVFPQCGDENLNSLCEQFNHEMNVTLQKSKYQNSVFIDKICFIFMFFFLTFESQDHLGMFFKDEVHQKLNNKI